MVRDRLGDGETGVSSSFVPPILNTLYSIANSKLVCRQEEKFVNPIITLYSNIEVRYIIKNFFPSAFIEHCCSICPTITENELKLIPYLIRMTKVDRVVGFEPTTSS